MPTIVEIRKQVFTFIVDKGDWCNALGKQFGKNWQMLDAHAL